MVEQLSEVGGKLAFGPPKTAAGRGSAALPAFLAEALGADMVSDGPKAGLVFTTANGEPLRRSNFSRWVWAPAVAAAGLEGLRFHDLRHTAVAIAIAQGAHPRRSRNGWVTRR